MRSEPGKCGRASGPASTAVTWSPRSGFGYLNVRRGAPIGVGRGRRIPPILSSTIGFADPLKPRYRDIDSLRADYEAKQDAIRARLEDFRRTGHKADEQLFEELCFCIVAIQSKARASDSAVADLRRTQLLWSGGPDEIATFLRHRTRFHNHKADFIARARERLFPQSHRELGKPVVSDPA